MTEPDPPPKTRFHKPPNVFKQKVGSGGIAPDRLRKAQNFIENTKVDFRPYAKEILREIEKTLSRYEKGNLPVREAMEQMISLVMQIKANGGMFRYEMVSEIAEGLLTFLEKIGGLNADGVTIVRMYLYALQSITVNAMTGGGGREGRSLVKELEYACERYAKKYGEE